MTAINYYVIDSSSLIELNRRYPIDVFPTLWQKVETLINNGQLISHKEVAKEISVMDDSLNKWAKKQKGFFKELDEKQMEIAKEILKNPEKYFTPEVMQALDEIAQKEFSYGKS